jgi:hypothetical protein
MKSNKQTNRNRENKANNTNKETQTRIKVENKQQAKKARFLCFSQKKKKKKKKTKTQKCFDAHFSLLFCCVLFVNQDKNANRTKQTPKINSFSLSFFLFFAFDKSPFFFSFFFFFFFLLDFYCCFERDNKATNAQNKRNACSQGQ